MNTKLHIILLGLFVMLASTMSAQQKSTLEKLEDKISSLDKKNKAFNFYINMQNSANVYLNDSDYEGIDFKTNQFRLEMRGEVVDGVRYRLRHRMNRGTSAENIDNMSRATDIASVSVDITDNFTITGGKQCTAFGGYEFDLNPIDIYQYSDMIDYMDNFLTGVDFAYRMNDQEFRFQVVNSRNATIDKVYGNQLPGDVVKSKQPLGYTLNWNGNLLDGMIQTRWSYSMFKEAKDEYMNYIALGTQVKFNEKVQLQFDWMNSHEDLDRKGIVSEIYQKHSGTGIRAKDAVYNSLIAKVDYKLNPKFNLFAKGMYETASNEGDINIGISEDYRTSYGYFGGVEYSPVQDNIKFYFLYVGRYYDYDDSLKSFGYNDYSTSRFSVGIVYRLKMF